MWEPVLTSCTHYPIVWEIGKSMKTRQSSTVTIMHPTNSLQHCFIECPLCAGTVLSMEEREARSILPVPGKIRAQVEWKRACNWEPEKSLWKGLKRMAQFNTWQCFLSRNQDPKSQGKVWSWVVIGCSVIHYLPLNSQRLLWTFGGLSALPSF